VNAAVAGLFSHFAPLYSAFNIAAPSVYAAAASDPDTLTYNEAMRDLAHLDQWKAAAAAEIRTLEQMGTWTEVPQSNAGQSKIPPRNLGLSPQAHSGWRD
jgi:hypothetical protein